MTTVHLIFNAHIDPIWLWPWPSGLDTLLATCRSACDLLDRHPDLHFCRGEAWGYEQIERVAPALFQRIRGHVQAGRWHIVGGWWIQPDCNGPSGFALARQIEVGKAYLLDRFGYFPRIAYNVDSFGHAATLPALMRAAGQDCYVMMRPQEQEMVLPGRVFRWCGDAGGPEVVTFRIAGAYACRDLTVAHVQAALAGLPAGIDHTMCFAGLGDHGGGPTDRQINWCREHERAIDGCRLVFSSPQRFFEAIWDQRDILPLVTGELQMHAVGCYSVYRPVKRAVRRTEHALRQAEIAAAADPRPEPDTVARLAEAWRRVCFSHFHDTFGGTCIPSAYEQVHAQLGLSCAVADEIIQLGLRRRMETLPDDPWQRIVLFNASDEAYDGYATHEPWFEHQPFQPHWRLIDEDGRAVPFQALHPEALVTYDHTYFLRLLFRVRVEPGALRVLRIDASDTATAVPGVGPAANPARVCATEGRVANDAGVSVQLAGEGRFEFAGAQHLPLPRLELIEDQSDTWSHGVDRYAETPVAAAIWGPPKVIDAGPLMGSLQRDGRVGSSTLSAEYRVYAGEPFIELLLQVHWSEHHKLLKLALPLPAPMVRHRDGIPGGELERAPDGRERPVRDRTLLELVDGRRVGVVCPDAYALDAAAQLLRVTLLRSPLMAHHDPYPAPGPRGVYADQGVHAFRFRFFCGAKITGRELDQQALLMHRPLVIADLTRGMLLS